MLLSFQCHSVTEQSYLLAYKYSTMNEESSRNIITGEARVARTETVAKTKTRSDRAKSGPGLDIP